MKLSAEDIRAILEWLWSGGGLPSSSLFNHDRQLVTRLTAELYVLQWEEQKP